MCTRMLPLDALRARAFGPRAALVIRSHRLKMDASGETSDDVPMPAGEDEGPSQQTGDPDSMETTSEQPSSSQAVEKSSESVQNPESCTQPQDQAPAKLFKVPMSLSSNKVQIQKTTGSAAQAFGEGSSEAAKKSKQPKNTSDSTNEDTTNNSGDPGSHKITEKSNKSKLSPAEQLKQQQVPIPYKEPKWGGLCQEDYSFEVIKNGIVMETTDLKTKSFFVYGRLPSCDITMEHPSLSRYHAVVQYCAEETDRHEIGWYLYDLDSTHGTWVNKTRVKPRVYVRLRVGHVVKFGGSSRLNILQGPVTDQEEESDLSVTELQEQREKQRKEAELLKQTDLLEAETNQRLQEEALADTGCSWGMDDPVPDNIDPENPFSLEKVPENEHLYIEDPKKALRGFFEREGHDLPEYELVEESRGKYKCRVELPVYDSHGEPLIAEATMSGKKKEVVLACALEACRLLDRHGELRKSTHESHARKKKNWEENDFYDSDDDTFLDRTGAIEKKRKIRMQKEKHKSDKAETYDSLIKKLSEIETEMAEIEAKLQHAKEQAASFDEEGLDAFDAYMAALKSGVLDTKTRTTLKRRMFELKQEKMKVERLANIAKPALPKIQQSPVTTPKGTKGPLFGKMKGTTKQPAKPHKPNPAAVSHEEKDFVVEEEDDDEEESTIKTSEKPSESDNLKKTNPNDSESLSRLKSNDSDLSRTKDISKDSQCEKVLGPSMPPAGIPMDTYESVNSDSTEDKNIVIEESNRKQNSESDIPEEKKDSLLEDINQGSSPQMAPPSTVPTKRRRQREREKSMKKPRSPALGESDYTDLTTDPDYDVWTPPTGQAGDGKTHLNDKYGY